MKKQPLCFAGRDSEQSRSQAVTWVVWLDNHPLCEADEIGDITYLSGNLSTPEYADAKDKAFHIVTTTAEYMRQMEHASPLQADSLEGRYKLLTDLSGTVLAGMYSQYGVQFVTWSWDHDRTGARLGHYFGGNYEGGKQDFATRSGLIKEQ